MSAKNSSLRHIATPYAKALYDLASEEGEIASTQKALAKIAKLAKDNSYFARLLSSPIVGAQEKSAAIEKILQKLKLSKLGANFIRLVAENDRLIALLDMIDIFDSIVEKARGETEAEVISASPLSKKQLEQLSKNLQNKIGKTVTLRTYVDSSLIGGLIVKVGSQMIDNSLKTKLNAMKIAMKEVG